MAGNFFCERSECALVAVAFGMTAGQKTKVCGNHMLELQAKHIPFFNIEAIHFMDSPEDWQLYLPISEFSKSALNYMGTLSTKWDKLAEDTYAQLQAS